MKKTLRMVLAAFVAVSMVAFVSCGKDLFNESNDNGGDSDLPTPGPGLSWIDLGLPSGLLWASCNVGATAPEEFGNYYAWGEVESKRDYSWSTYRYGDGSERLTKYCNNPNYGLNRYTDTLTTLEPEDDAATALIGDGARTPTRLDWQELMQNTTYAWTTENGVNGCRFTGTNGNSIFLPAAGGWTETEFFGAGDFGDYWSSSFEWGSPYNAWDLLIKSDVQSMGTYERCYGYSVRAVRDNQN